MCREESNIRCPRHDYLELPPRERTQLSIAENTGHRVARAARFLPIAMLYVAKQHNTSSFNLLKYRRARSIRRSICDEMFMPLSESSCSIPMCRSANTSALPTVSAGSFMIGRGSAKPIRFPRQIHSFAPLSHKMLSLVTSKKKWGPSSGNKKMRDKQQNLA